MAKDITRGRRWLLGVAQSAMRALPDRLAGKTRVGNWLLSKLAPATGGEIVGNYGLRYEVPSYREPIALGLFNSGIYEPTTVATILAHLPDDGVLIDVGANIGAISLPIAVNRPSAKIIAIEADAEICRLLRANVTHNLMTQVMVCEALVGDRAQTEVAFYRAPSDKFGMGSIGSQFLGDSIRLTQRTLSDLLAGLKISKVDVIKIDVEGAEHKVLQGARDILCSVHPPVVIFEFMDWAEERIPGQKAGDAQRLLMELGYCLQIVGEEGNNLNGPMISGGAMLVAHSSGRFATSAKNR